MLKRLKVVLFTCAVFLLGFVAKVLLDTPEVVEFLSDNAGLISIVTVGILLLLALVLYLVFWILPWWLKRRLGRSISDMSDGEMLKALGNRFFFGDVDASNLTTIEQQNLAMQRFGSWWMRREAIALYFSVCVAVGGGVIGSATVFLLYQQNNKLVLQTDATIIQSLLIESNRRAALNSELERLQNAIYEEVENPDALPVCSGNNSYETCTNYGYSFRLGQEIFDEIRAFLTRSTPYHVLDSAPSEPNFDAPLREQVLLHYISPERGTLFRTFLARDIEVKGWDFSSSQLDRSQLISETLDGVTLRNASLVDANLSGATLVDAILSDANLSNSRLVNTTFDGTNLTGANLSNARLFRANFTRAQLRDANLTNADLDGVNFSNAGLFRVKYENKETFEGTWAWRDLPPFDAEGLPIVLCSFDPQKHRREEKPNDCPVGSSYGQSEETAQ